jgi:hypothetical protein
MLPFVLTILVLTLVTIRNNRRGIQVMPAALGKVFSEAKSTNLCAFLSGGVPDTVTNQFVVVFIIF